MPMKKLIILDIDETLLYSTYENLDREPDFLFKERKVFLRPNCIQFIDYCFENFDVAIWTSSKSVYAKFVLTKMLKDISKFKFIWTRKNCEKRVIDNGFSNEIVYVKNINNIVGYTKNNILFIDDTPQNIFPTDNVIPIAEYRGNQLDNSLDLIITQLSSKINI